MQDGESADATTTDGHSTVRRVLAVWRVSFETTMQSFDPTTRSRGDQAVVFIFLFSLPVEA